MTDPISKEQSEYLNQIQRKKYWIRVTQVLLLLLLLFAWETAVSKNILNGFIFSSPSRIIRCFYGMVTDHSIFLHIGVTLAETLVSFALITLFSVLIATILWWFPTAAKIIDPYLVVLNSLPKSALAPILIVWLGNNMKTIIITAISIAVFGSILNLYSGFLHVDKERLTLIRTLGGTKKDCLTMAVIPSCIPLLLSIMNVNIGLSLVGVIIGEFLAARSGLGYLIIYGSQVFRLERKKTKLHLLSFLFTFIQQSPSPFLHRIPLLIF